MVKINVILGENDFIISGEMKQGDINTRLRILVETLAMNVRSFSLKLGISDSTARNYIDRGSKPPADFIATVVDSIEGVNPSWLLLGKGEMFLNETKKAQVRQPSKNEGQTIGTNDGSATMNFNTIDECRRELLATQRENEMLRSQLKDKDRIIQLLEMQLKE